MSDFTKLAKIPPANPDNLSSPNELAKKLESLIG